MNNSFTYNYNGKFAAIIAALLLFYCIRPYFFWSGIFLNNYFNGVINIILGFIFFLNRKNLNTTEKLLMLLLLGIIIAFPFVNAQNFNVFMSILPLLFLPFAADGFHRTTYNYLLNIYCFFVGLSLIVWVFAIFGIISPIKVIEPLNSLKDYKYYIYPLLVRETYESYRFCGLFDEPGVVGTISGLFLCCQRDFKSKQSIIILLSGLCSLSLFFYVIAAFYFMFNYVLAAKSIKSSLLYSCIALIIIILASNSPIFTDYIGSRLEWDESTGKFTGDNRTAEYAEDVFNQILGTRAFWFGIDNKWEFQQDIAHSSSILNVVIMNGIIFTFLIFAFYLLYGWLYRASTRTFLIYIFVVVGTLYQRPYFFHPEFIFLWTALARKAFLFNSPSNNTLSINTSPY